MTKIYLTILFLFSIALYSNGQDIDFKEVNIMCLDLNSLEKQTIIKSNYEYNDILKKKLPGTDCNSDSNPQINFNENILLGFLIESGGCSPPSYIIKVYEAEKKVVFELNVSPNGICRVLYQKMVWITISKKINKEISFIEKYSQRK